MEGLQIESCCLQRHPIQTDTEFYDKYKCRNDHLKLKSIRRSDADLVLQTFFKLNVLALDDMEVYDNLRWFPRHLVSLTISNSVIERHLLQNWLDKNRSWLEFLKIDNVDHSFPLRGKVDGLWKPLNLENYCPQLFDYSRRFVERQSRL